MSKLPAETIQGIGEGELSKDAIRQTVWEYLENNNLVNFPRPVFNRIPNFKGAAPAAEKMVTLDEFKKANTIKINPDKPQENCRFLTIESEKTLLVPTPRLRTGLFNKIVVPENAGKGLLRICSTTQGIREHSEPIGLEDKVKVDLVIIGCVAVSKQGYRIGKGEGFGDLEYAMMRSMGAIDSDTVVIATVHESQVMDIPASLVQPHDVMVNYIVTPNEIITCSCDKPQPKGIIWSMLTPEKMKHIPVLKRLRIREREAGVDVTLKDGAEFDDTVEDEEDDDNYRRNNYRRRPNFRRGGGGRYRGYRPRRSEGDDQEEHANGEAGEENEDSGGENNRRRPYGRNRRFRRRRGPREGDREGGEYSNDQNEEEGENKRYRRRRRGDNEHNENEEEGGDGGERRQRRRRPRPPRRRRNTDERNEENEDEGERRPPPRRFRRGPPRERNSETEENGDGEGRRRFRGGPPRARMPTIFIGSIPNSVRVSELKTQIRGMDVNPIRIIWHGARGYAFFQFTKAEEMETALDTLQDIEIKGKKLRVEMSTVLNRKRSGDSGAEGDREDKENIPQQSNVQNED